MASSFSFNIPDKDRMALKAISDMDERQFQIFSTAVQETRPRLGPKGLANQLTDNTSLAFVKSELPSIVRIIANLGRGIYLDDLNLEEVTANLAEYAVEERLISDNETKELERRLYALFSFDVVKLISKANAVLTSHPYTYGAAKIFTEIRPLFTDDEIVAPPSTSVIAHQLRFDTVHNGSKEEIFIALDDQDLVALREVIQRAIRKSALLIAGEKEAGRSVITE